jgi:3-methyladenine DNA glycosylase AlkD
MQTCSPDTVAVVPSAQPDRQLIAAVRDRLRDRGDPARAPGMRAYMKSAMPYRGVPAAGQRAIARELFGAHPIGGRAAWRATVLALWREAEYREERYLAIALSGAKPYAAYQDPAELPVYEELIVTGAWWDYVDEVAIRRVGPILRGHRREVTPIMYAWAGDADPWKRRTAIICQVTARTEVDLDLLEHAIAANSADSGFFLRKAIGWALRDLAWHDPDWVRRYVGAHPELSGLSRREALKNIAAENTATTRNTGAE